MECEIYLAPECKIHLAPECKIHLAKSCEKFIPLRGIVQDKSCTPGVRLIPQHDLPQPFRRTAFWIVFGRALNLVVGAVLLVWLVGRIAAFIWLFAEGGLAGIIAQAAKGGISTGEWLGQVVLGN